MLLRCWTGWQLWLGTHQGAGSPHSKYKIQWYCWAQLHRSEFTFTLLLCLITKNKKEIKISPFCPCLSVSWNFTSGISGISGSAEGASALVGGTFPLSPGGFSPLEPSLLFSSVSMSQSRLFSWKQRELFALIHCLFFIYTIFYTVESHWIHQNNKARRIDLCMFYFSDSSE